MRRYLLLFCCLLLAGCGNKIADQMIKEAKDAFEDKSYERAVGLLKLASDESSNKSYEVWYEQGEAFLNMLEYDDLTLFDDLLLAWTDLNLIDSEPSFVKEEAVAYIKTQLESVKELAKEVVSANADIDISNEAKKRSAVAYINRELIESSQYTYETLPTQEIDDAIEEVLHDN